MDTFFTFFTIQNLQISTGLPHKLYLSGLKDQLGLIRTAMYTRMGERRSEMIGLSFTEKEVKSLIVNETSRFLFLHLK